MTLSRGTDSDEFAVLAAKLEPVTEVLHLSGAPDYLLRVACKDTAELDALLENAPQPRRRRRHRDHDRPAVGAGPTRA